MNTRANCSCPDICPASRAEEQQDEWSSTLENLTSFLSASASLVQDLRQTIQGTQAFDVCPVEEVQEQKDSSLQKQLKVQKEAPIQQEAPVQKEAKGNCICDPAPCNRLQKEVTVQQEALIQKEAKGNCICNPSPCNRPPKATGDARLQSPSASTIVLEPQYEACHEEILEPKEELKKPPKPKQSKKQKYEQYTKEKTEKLVNLKQSITVAQKNLLDVQEQLRQLERLFQDYTSANTPEGQVNPAALFKEIMKPQSVPYIKPTPGAPSCFCDSCLDSTSRTVRTPSKPEQKSAKKIALSENVSVLSAVPLNEPFI